MVRVKSFQFFYWLVVITFVGLMGLVTFIRPLDHKQQELVQTVGREPLVLENENTNQNESLFNETKIVSESTTVEDKVETTEKPVVPISSKPVEDKVLAILSKKEEIKKEIQKPLVTSTTEKPPSLVKEEYTTSLKKVKIGKKVNITYDSPIKYKGPIGKGLLLKFCPLVVIL